MTTSIPAPTDEDPIPPARPARPAWVELAAALLIVGGAIGALGALVGAGGVPPGAGPFVIVAVGLAIGSIVLGLLVRMGRAWLVALNYAAVLGFVDLLGAGASAVALMLGLADILVVGILLAHKPWFDALARQPLMPPTARPPTR